MAALEKSSRGSKSRLAGSLGPLAYNLVVDLGLILLGWGVSGGLAGFWDHPARLGIAAIFIVLELAAAAARWSVPEPPAPRPETWFNELYRENGRFLQQEMVYALAPLSDRRGILVLPDSGLIRLAGLLIFAAAGAWMVWAVTARRRSLRSMPPELRQPLLVESGPYSQVRHPLFLGNLVRCVGISLAFRSIGGLFLVLLMLVAVLRRINWLEKEPAKAIPLQWTSYLRRSWRLVPRLF